MVEFEGKKCKSFILYFVLVFSIELVWWIFCKLTHAEFSLRALIILIFLLGVGVLSEQPAHCQDSMIVSHNSQGSLPVLLEVWGVPFIQRQ